MDQWILTDVESYFISVTNVRLVCLLPIVAYTYVCRFWPTCWYNLKCFLFQYYIWIIQYNASVVLKIRIGRN